MLNKLELSLWRVSSTLGSSSPIILEDILLHQHKVTFPWYTERTNYLVPVVTNQPDEAKSLIFVDEHFSHLSVLLKHLSEFSFFAVDQISHKKPATSGKLSFPGFVVWRIPAAWIATFWSRWFRWLAKSLFRWFVAPCVGGISVRFGFRRLATRTTVFSIAVFVLGFYRD